jgi:hypothetical protein
MSVVPPKRSYKLQPMLVSINVEQLFEFKKKYQFNFGSLNIPKK